MKVSGIGSDDGGGQNCDSEVEMVMVWQLWSHGLEGRRRKV